MQEYVSEAVVLNGEPVGDLDLRVSLYTRKYGKLRARGISIKKITSKLAGHLQPGMLSGVRVVEKKGLRVVDALKIGSVAAPPPKLYFLDGLLHDAEPDPEIWNLLAGGPRADFAWADMLRLLGWDPAHAACAVCEAEPPAAFHLKNQEFFCASCARASKARPDTLLWIL